MCRFIWLRRNNLVFEGKAESPCTTMTKVVSQLEEFHKAQLRETQRQTNQPTVVVNKMWQPPDFHTTKANQDASCDFHNNITGLGGIFKDSEGEILASICSFKHLIHRPELVKALALRRIMKLSLELGFSYVVFEGDCQWLINLVNSNFESLSDLRLVLYDIQQLLNQHPLQSIKFIYREANKVANNLAKWAIHNDNELLWIEDCLSNVMSLVLFDKFCIDIVS